MRAVVERSDDASCLFGTRGLAVEGVVFIEAGFKIVQLGTDDPDAARCPVGGSWSRRARTARSGRRVNGRRRLRRLSELGQRRPTGHATDAAAAGTGVALARRNPTRELASLSSCLTKAPGVGRPARGRPRVSTPETLAVATRARPSGRRGSRRRRGECL